MKDMMPFAHSSFEAVWDAGDSIYLSGLEDLETPYLILRIR